MTTALKEFLIAFDHLSPAEQRQALLLMLRRSADRATSPLDDESLAQIADETFQEYDAREAADADR